MGDPDILRLIASKTGLGLNYLSKDEKISVLLTQLNIEFPENVFLKGGTAINRVYLRERGRFSEDIDLDFIIQQNLSQKIKKLTDGMKSIQGFDISKPRIMHRTVRFDCTYINEFGQKDRVQVEFYLSHKRLLCTKKPEKRIVASPFVETSPTLFNVYPFEDLLSRKIITLFNRCEGKDVYDVFHALDLKIDFSSLHKAMEILLRFYRIQHNIETFLEKLKAKLEDAEKKASYIGNATNHFIPRDLRPEWEIFIASLIIKIEELTVKVR